MKILVVNGHVYECGNRTVQNTIDLVRNSCVKKKLTMIYCLQKANKYDMVNLKFDSVEDMEKQVKEFEGQGFKVYRANFGE